LGAGTLSVRFASHCRRSIMGRRKACADESGLPLNEKLYSPFRPKAVPRHFAQPATAFNIDALISTCAPVTAMVRSGHPKSILLKISVSRFERRFTRFEREVPTHRRRSSFAIAVNHDHFAKHSLNTR
jgi:hypothetical protein